MAAYSEKTALKRVDPNRWAGVYCRKSEERKCGSGADVCYYITFKREGKKVWEKVGWKSEGYSPQVAADLRADRQRAARHGGDVKTAKEIRQEKADQNKTLDELADLYFQQRGGNAQAAKFDRYRYDKHVSPLLGNKPVQDITHDDINNIKAAMEGKAVATIWGALEMIRRIANYGKKNKKCPGLSFIIAMPDRNNIKVEYLTPEQVTKFVDVLNAWPHQEVARMLKVAMFTGLRRGEIFKLEDSDIDFIQKIITLRNPKSGKDANVPLNSVVEKIIKEQIEWRKEKFPESTYIFPGKGGGLRVDSTAVERIKKKAELPGKFRIFHGLRHHYAVTLANSGKFTLDMIGELLTHSDPKITRERYAHFLPGAKKEAAEQALELLFPQGGE
nr:site-specific integrase [uncultured Desulfobulbus sp.]